MSESQAETTGAVQTPTGSAKVGITFYVTRQFSEYIDSFCDHLRIARPQLIEHGIVALAAEKAYPSPPGRLKIEDGCRPKGNGHGGPRRNAGRKPQSHA